MTNHPTPDEFTARLNNSPWLLPKNRPRPKPEPEDPTTHSGFRRMLQGIIGPDELLWPSESDYKVEVVRIADSVVFNWVPEIHQHIDFPHDKLFERPYEWIQDIAHSSDADARFMAMVYPFVRHPDSRIFYRLTEEPNVYNLYLLVRFKDRWVGLKTIVVET